ncbi:TetR/AcrR family transcriptional regulator [Thermohalobacter berrensis]|uniref:HTH tetR-type domain-containing protein n=1 Tax=Thermohalobacter berrensis TaxID=99594 RepID=A0A419T100_9FIRM|nr:TetR/AcrR family transcriptional regulator [Thermohalobacter berrensis]RKD31234.1 hypothetical protein BET03_03660 [Thermohalobacter berrensis]
MGPSKKAQKTKERILKAAIEIFSEKGYSAARTSEIAKKAGVAEGTIFRYFPKKKDLLHEIVLEAIDTFGEIIALSSLKKVVEENKEKSLEEFLKAIVLDRVKIFNNYFNLAKVVFYEMQFHEDVRKMFVDKIAKKAVNLGKEIFGERQEMGDLKDIDLLIAARSFMGMVFIMLIQKQFLPEVSTTNDFEKEIETVIDIFLNGVKKRD